MVGLCTIIILKNYTETEKDREGQRQRQREEKTGQDKNTREDEIGEIRQDKNLKGRDKMKDKTR